MTDLVPRYQAEPWIEYADCRSIGTDAFYPEMGDSWTEAIEVCEACPVRLLCLDYAMRSEIDRPAKHRFGIFGGLKPHQRKKHEPDWLAEQQGEIAA